MRDKAIFFVFLFGILSIYSLYPLFWFDDLLSVVPFLLGLFLPFITIIALALLNRKSVFMKPMIFLVLIHYTVGLYYFDLPNMVTSRLMDSYVDKHHSHLTKIEDILDSVYKNSNKTVIYASEQEIDREEFLTQEQKEELKSSMRIIGIPWVQFNEDGFFLDGGGLLDGMWLFGNIRNSEIATNQTKLNHSLRDNWYHHVGYDVANRRRVSTD